MRETEARFPGWQFTLRWMMTRIAVIAAALALLVAAARQSEKYHCGHPFLDAVSILFLLAFGYPLARAMASAYKWNPPPPN